jgi:hypothetical protein
MNGDGTSQHLQLRHLIEEIDKSRNRTTGGDHIIKDDHPPGCAGYQEIDVSFVKG